MEKFTHGVMAINPNNKDENDDLEILHFVGYWNEPDEDDVIEIWEILKNDNTFTSNHNIDEVELIPAPEEIVDYFNNSIEGGLIEIEDDY